LNDEPRLDRLEELLADRALQGSAPADLAELRHLEPDFEAEGIALELAAAEAELALAPFADEPLPAALLDRLEADAATYFNPPPRRRSLARRVVPWLGWAAAASILVATQLRREPIPDSSPRPVPLVTPTLANRLQGVPTRPLAATSHPLARGAGGTLAWDGDRQEGLLSVRGLAEVEPSKGVYQLWIFDESRDERFPVDGGTFAVEDSTAATVVPVRPSLQVRRPTLFAVTLEPPGGVVVSDRKRILLTASPAP
jgi:hypothetical protein